MALCLVNQNLLKISHKSTANNIHVLYDIFLMRSDNVDGDVLFVLYIQPNHHTDKTMPIESLKDISNI